MFRTLLMATACLIPGIAHADWQQASSTHFVVYSNDSPENVKAITRRLERFDRAVRAVLHLSDPEIGPDARVVVFVVPEVSDVQKMAGKAMGDVAGFYNDDWPSGPYAVVPKHSENESDNSLSALTILQHEYTHHLMYSNWGDVVFPTWFSEGFAEFFATARVNDSGDVFIGGFPRYRTYGMADMNRMPLKKLMSGPPNYHDAMEAQAFYGRSWLLMHYMLFDPEGKKRLAAYIVAVNAGKSDAEASAILGVTWSFDLKLNNYLQEKRIPSTTLSASQLPIVEVTSRPLTPGEATVMPALMRSHNGVDQKQAQIVVAQARQLAAPYPNDAGAQNELAEAEHDAGNYALSEAAADRALAADPKSVHALIYKGMALMALAEKAGNKDPAVWATARRWFLAANKADPLYSYPVQLYYESFAQAKQAPTQGAKDGLFYAYKLSPQLLGLRYEVAKVLLRDGSAKPARIALEPIAYNEHGGDFVDRAKQAIAALDSGGAAAAIKVIDDAEAKAKADAEKAKDKPSDKKD